MSQHDTRKDRRENVTADRIASRKARARQNRYDDRQSKRDLRTYR